MARSFAPGLFGPRNPSLWFNDQPPQAVVGPRHRLQSDGGGRTVVFGLEPSCELVAHGGSRLMGLRRLASLREPFFDRGRLLRFQGVVSTKRRFFGSAPGGEQKPWARIGCSRVCPRVVVKLQKSLGVSLIQRAVRRMYGVKVAMHLTAGTGI